MKAAVPVIEQEAFCLRICFMLCFWKYPVQLSIHIQNEYACMPRPALSTPTAQRFNHVDSYTAPLSKEDERLRSTLSISI